MARGRRDLAPLIGVFILLSLVELPVVHLLLPWDTVRIAVLILSVWGLIWMLGFLAGASITARRDSVADGRHVQVDDTVLHVAVVKQTRAQVLLHGPAPIALPEQITGVRFYANNARDLVASARARFPARAA